MNPKFIKLADNYYVSPQISEAEAAEAAAAGFDLIVNNRPDHEEEGQPLSAEIEAAAKAAGIAYLAIPIGRDGISREDIDALQSASASHSKILGYCRTGTRSTILRAMMQAKAGMDPEAIIAEAAAGGYDISAQRGAFESLNQQN
jgi:uncharacterized protein (TIGR01244 family)